MVLLDTCAAIWIANGDPMSPKSLEAIRSAAVIGAVFVSPVSAWEVGLLASKAGVIFSPSPRAWFAALLARPGVRLAPLTPEAAISSSCLPGDFNSDPADRLLVASARDMAAPLVTRDRHILRYARAGHVGAIAC